MPHLTPCFLYILIINVIYKSMKKIQDFNPPQAGGRLKKLKWLACLCISLFCGIAVQAGNQTRNQQLTLNLKDATLETFIREVKQQTGYTFFYNDQIAKAVEPITMQKEKIDLKEALREVLQSKGFNFSIEDNTIIIRRNTTPQSEQKRTIQGVVVNTKGEPIPGATVQLKGTLLGSSTDGGGKFSLTLPVQENTVLVFSFIGMESKEINYTGQTELRVVLEDLDVELEGVVVTGIFKKAKESYTGAVSSITNEELKMYRGQNLLQTLKNIDASLNFAVDNVSGSNPNRVPQINIRGNSSLPISVQEYNESARNDVNAPLIILDGFEVSMERLMDYNDEEIEQINILKDAAATAIYGSRGSNGVIVVITKQPEVGRLRVNAEIGLDIEAPDLTSYDLLNAADKLELERSLGLYDNTVSPSNDVWYKEAYYKRLRAVLSGTDTDWLSKPTRTGVGAHYNIRMEGGSEEFRWSGTASYKDVRGAMKGSFRRTFNGSITLMYSLNNLIFKNSLTYGYSLGQESKYGSFSTYANQQPYNAPYDTEGALVRYFDGFHKNTYKVQNPLFDATLNSFDKSGYNTLTNNFSIEWMIFEGLTLRGQIGVSGTNSTGDIFLPAEHSTFSEDDYYNTDEGFLRRGSYTYSTGKSNSYDGNLTLSYSRTFEEKHLLYIGVDYALSESRSQNYRIAAEGFTNEDINFLASARQYAKDGAPSGSKGKTRRFGLTANVNYTYDNRYFVDFSFRMDGKSTFGSKKKYAPFWSSGIGWNLHNEEFMKGSVANILRLKTSYGQTGTQQGSSSGSETVYKYITDNRYMQWTGALLSNWGNPYLTWQKTNEFNIGTEFGFLNGRIKGEFNYYSKVTNNLLSNRDIPHSMGFSYYLANIGEVKNRGWEASATAYLIRDTQREINWMIGAQLVYNKNYISKLSDAVKEQNEIYLKEDVDIANLFYEGKPQNAIYAVRSWGIDPSTGKEVYLDKNGLQTDIWNASDKVYLGPSDPKFRGNMNTMFMWKGLTVNLSFGFYWGGKVYNQTLVDRVEVTTNSLKSTNVDARVFYDRWKKPGDVVSFKKFDNVATRATSRFVMNENTLEIQSVGIQYKWNNPWLKANTPLTNITIGVNMSDLFHFSTVKMERGTGYPYARNIQGSIKFLF